MGATIRTLIALAAVTVITGCAAAAPAGPPPDFAAPDELTSCSVRLPQDWKDELARNETHTGVNEKVTVLAANESADTTIVRTRRDDTTELVLRDSGHRQQVMKVEGEAQIFGVEFDGRWVTFVTTPHPENHSMTVYAWDSKKDGAPVRIDGAGTPVLRNGKATWTDDKKKVHLYDLATKKDKVIGEGQAPVFFGDTVMWAQRGRFQAARLDGTAVAAPQQLSSAAPDPSVASDGRTLVWTQGAVLHGWRADWQATRELAAIKPGKDIASPRVSGDLVSWSAETPYVTDIRTGATAYITATRDWYEVRGGAMTIAGWRKAASAPASALSQLPAC